MASRSNLERFVPIALVDEREAGRRVGHDERRGEVDGGPRGRRRC